MDLLHLGSKGLEGPDQSFFVDAWRPVPTNIVTHAHADHAHSGSGTYICAEPGAEILRHRLGKDTSITSVPYGEKFKLGSSWVSLHPAGHILGSAQVRVENGSDVTVFTGDFKRDDDPTCDAFEVVECDTFITEATFALPIYVWQPMEVTAREILNWWLWCKEEKTTAILHVYALGKAQRILAELAKLTDETVYLHGAVCELTNIYRSRGVKMLPTLPVTEAEGSWEGRLVLAPPSAHRSTWMKRFKSVSTGFASGWMSVRGIRRRRGYERGFVVSDHADWPSLIKTVDDTKAKRVLVTHGGSETLAKYLRESRGIDAQPLKTEFAGEDSD